MSYLYVALTLNLLLDPLISYRNQLYYILTNLRMIITTMIIITAMITTIIIIVMIVLKTTVLVFRKLII